MSLIVKLRTLFRAPLVYSLALVAGQVKGPPASTTAITKIPHLRKQGTATQMIVDGKPYLAVAGELANTASSDLETMKTVWPRWQGFVRG